MKYLVLLLLLAGTLPFSRGQLRFQSTRIIDTRNGLPQGFIPGIIQDHRGFIWVSTQDGLCRYDGYTFKVYRPAPDDPTALPFRNVGQLAQDALHRIWMRSETNQVALMTYETGRFRTLAIPGLDRHLSGNDPIIRFAPDPTGGMWLSTVGSRLYHIPADLSSIQPLQPRIRRDLNTDQVHDVWQAPDQTVWVATNRGLGCRRPGQQAFQPVSLGAYDQTPVYSVSGRPDGRLVLGLASRVLVLSARAAVEWDILLPYGVGTRYPEVRQIQSDRQGYTYVTIADRMFRFRGPGTLQEIDWSPRQWEEGGQLHSLGVATLLIDQTEQLWIGTSGYGLVHINLREPPFRSAPYRVNFHIDVLMHQYGLRLADIPDILRDVTPYNVRYLIRPDGSLWFGARRFFCHFTPQTRTFRFIQPPAGRGVSPSAGPETIALHGLDADPHGIIWGLTNQHLFTCDPRTYECRFFPLAQPPTEWLDFVLDAETFWATTVGSGLWSMNRKTGKIRYFRHSADTFSLPSNRLLDVVQDPLQPDSLWISTYDFGLCHFSKKTGRCRRYSTRNGLPNDVVYCIIPTPGGYLWISTNKGLSRFNARTGQVLTYNASDGLQGDEFNRFHGVRMPDGTLYVGGVNGISWFDPQRINHLDHFKPTVLLTDLRINNQLIEPGRPGSILSNILNETRELSLAHTQNFLTIEFSAAQYNNRDGTQYRYRLLHYDRTWVLSGTTHSAIYTGLPPGRYVFEVQATNTSGLWSPHVKSLTIVIHPPSWATWWAYCLYTFLLGSLAFQYVRFRTRRDRERQEMELKRREADQLRQMDEMKTRFFSNITHEFRTPLTLIQAPTEQLLKEIDDPQQVRSLTTIHHNAEQLLRLINQLLDLSKLEANALTVSSARGNLGAFLERTVDLFQARARQKHITLTLERDPFENDHWFDAEKLEVIIYNLLSNALKFTPGGGAVRVGSRLVNGGLELSVQDTGIGIADSQLPHIFERFYQGDDSFTRAYRGTGIGLALVQELVQLLKGELSVESTPGKGTTFWVQLPVRAVESSRAPSGPRLPEPLPTQQQAPAVPVRTPPVASPEAGPLILLAEDNAELAEFTENLLRGANYRVRRTHNGREALEVALAEMPDLILSDVMMPELDGFALCERLKQDDRTSHIGLILLTAKSAPASRLAGYEYGADDYISKPFRADELLLRIRNRLRYQQRLQNHLRQLLTAEAAPVAVEDPFLRKIYALLDRHLDEATYGVNELAADLAMSRMSLYRKLKAVSDLTPNELIRNYRLQVSLALLQTGKTVAEVAYAVGFESAQYYATCFRELFHSTPSEYASRKAAPSRL